MTFLVIKGQKENLTEVAWAYYQSDIRILLLEVFWCVSNDCRYGHIWGSAYDYHVFLYKVKCIEMRQKKTHCAHFKHKHKIFCACQMRMDKCCTKNKKLTR